MKLLENPRVIKDITLPKKFVKTRKKKGDVEEKPLIKYTLLREGNKDNVNKFIELYKQDKFKARVKYFNGNNTYTFSRLVLFEKNNGDFEICNFTTKFGISITSKMYSTQSKEEAIIYKDKKFWHKTKKRIMPLTVSALIRFIRSNENIDGYTRAEFSISTFKNRSKIFDLFDERFHWFKTVLEFPKKNILTLTSIVQHKLFGLKDLYRYVYKVPYNISKMVFENLKEERGYSFDEDSYNDIYRWKNYIKVLENIDQLTPEMLQYKDFDDTCKMAKTLGRKINCKWGLKRLKEAHDDWALEISNILLDCEVEYDLKLRDEFKAFADFFKYKMMITNKDMLREGMMQHHCVGTYISRVDRGECAIFHVDGYTLQVGIKEEPRQIRVQPDQEVFGNGRINMPVTRMVMVKTITNMQFRGKYNVSPPEEIVSSVNALIEEFNNSDILMNLGKENLPQPEDYIEDDDDVIAGFDDLDDLAF